MRNLKLLREEKGVSQLTVANVIGVNQQSIQRYESGEYRPDILSLSLLADYFDTSIDFIVGRTVVRESIIVHDDYALNHEETTLIDEVRGFAPEYRKFLATMLHDLKKTANEKE